MSFRCEAAAATTMADEAADLSMSMGSDEEAPDEEPDEVSELGVDAAVDDCVELEEVLVASGSWAVIQGWFISSTRLGRSLGRTLRHWRIMSWHSCVSLARNRTSALQMASSFS